MTLDIEILSSMREVLINQIGKERFEHESKCVHRWLTTAANWLYLGRATDVKVNLFRFGYDDNKYIKVIINESHSCLAREQDIVHLYNVKEDK